VIPRTCVTLEIYRVLKDVLLAALQSRRYRAPELMGVHDRLQDCSDSAHDAWAASRGHCSGDHADGARPVIHLASGGNHGGRCSGFRAALGGHPGEDRGVYSNS
jgi:hypothetical protein